MKGTQGVLVVSSRVTLAPFTRDVLPLAASWFDDPATRRFLGGPDWPARMLDLAETAVGSIFRGRRVLSCHRWLAWLEGTAVAYVDCGVTDRWTLCAPGAAGIEVVASLPGPAGALALVVDPARRNRGLGRAVVQAMCEQPAVAQVRLFGAGVDPDNIAVRRCLEATGFRLHAEAPDWEGMLSYLRTVET
jgi:RimJ/RimL family protein N-acetyltransferase